MFVVSLKLTGAMELAKQHMQSHKAWLDEGIKNGTFILVGNLKPGPGGALFVQGINREELEAKLSEDPFVREKIVEVSIIEIEAHTASDSLNCLIGK
ncbi:conserved hypothetical protein [Vibrio nigripulchritudo SO65]|uniref:YciI family protein n=1 Tax=Vibrio nigripulchritudo TaxID=28173 RepID=UPI0003B1B0B5|nr:hypothetical protein [Vibrio nigripulchritudo]CCN33755.1 conserved hypothetical protein [Vibrio nigripulchritudo AM115]CCN41957.1 conserved hypothetical protein [Vibrio nigripulchritudo FTn2]CCN66251.1 conserved hypothetical protein [Vibrio nigripulchritudo POn4]CCN72289.1 conserved hypothetical protein [Vibrio nigripulchritudo SFn118]CCN74609.1 conserved hypothetical protein [Vibrio nigripulchritudo SO65]